MIIIDLSLLRLLLEPALKVSGLKVGACASTSGPNHACMARIVGIKGE
jgi:hypothetical protein